MIGKQCSDAVCGSVCVAFAVGITALLPAAEFVWHGTADNVLSMADPANYTVDGETATRLPGANDTIKLDAGSCMVVSNDTIAVLNSVSSVQLRTRSRMVFNVTTNAHVTVPVSSYDTSTGYASALGTIEKNFDSELSFDAVSSGFVYGTNSQHADYLSERIEVNAGRLFLFNTGDGQYNKKIFMLGTLDVAEGAAVFLPRPGYAYIRGLAGAGLVTNDCESAYSPLIRLQIGPSTFEGVVASRSNLEQFAVVGSQRLTGVNSTVSSSKFCVDAPSGGVGYAGIVSFGANNDSVPSSIGKGGIQFVATAGTPHLEYLGAGGESTSKTIYIYGGSGHPCIVDGGANGGLKFTGRWYGGTALASFGAINLVLAGSNTTAMTLGNRIEDCVLNNSNASANEWYMQTRPLSITKRGTGAWRMSSAERSFSGIVAVEEGTLRFESIAERGEACSLGSASNCCVSASAPYEPFTGKDYADASPVGYAIRLGDPSNLTKTGIIEYCGSSDAACATRPIAVSGCGGILSTGGSLDLSGVSPCLAGENTLLLGGAGKCDVLRDVTNNVGNLSIVKKGEGTWTLLGKQTFSGDVSVEEGTLNIGAKYTWFRVNFHQNNTNSTKWETNTKHVKVREFGLFDDNGVRCNSGLEYVANTKVGTALSNIDLEPGQTDYCQGPGALHVGNNYANYDPSKLFDGNSGTFYYAAGNVPMDNESDSGKWLRIEFRLADDAGEATSLDLLPYDYTQAEGVFTPIAWSLDGSHDGTTWTTLFATNGLAPADYTNGKWFSDGSDFSASAAHTGIRFKTMTDGMDISPGIRSIRVKPGAVLSVAGNASVMVDKIVIDVAGMGTVKGVSLASSGTIDIVGDFPAGGFTIPADISGLDGYASFASGCTFTRNGGGMGGYRAKLADSGVVVVKKGLGISIR